MKQKVATYLKSILASHTAVVIAVVAMGLVTSSLAWYTSYVSTSRTVEERLRNESTLLESALQKRLRTYEEILRGGAGLFYVNDLQVTQDDWHEYMSTFDITHRYPGLRGIGFARYVPRDRVVDFESEMQANGYPDFRIFPVGDRPEYTAIMYLEPEISGVSTAVGYDMFAEPTRREAMVRARDTGQPALSHVVPLVTTNGTPNNVQGILEYIPIYSTPAPTTVAQRQQQLVGYIYAPIRVEDLFKGILGSELHSASQMTVYDVLPNGDQKIIFDSAPANKQGVPTETDVHIGTLTLHVRLYAYPSLLSPAEQNRATIVLISGLLLSASITMLLQYVMRNRLRELNYQRQSEVTKAKDELLSLASHQLRTPATGVKQYLGMVLQGYVGDITTEQRSMLQRANISNERQIEIVNQILHVTRLENGRIVLHRKPTDLVALVKDVVDEQKETISSRKQRIITSLPKRPLMAAVDPQYLRMAIENLVSNASKYTRDSGTVQVELYRRTGFVAIRVRDDGVGIDQADFPRLFQKFSRIDNDLSIVAGGSGIGLYLTRQIVDLHKGEIDAESEPGLGSEFIIRLPIATSRHDTEQ